MEGDQIQAHTQGGNGGGSGPGPHPRGKLRGIRSKPPPQDTATAADGTHPTGMHSCLCVISITSFNDLSEFAMEH